MSERTDLVEKAIKLNAERLANARQFLARTKELVREFIASDRPLERRAFALSDEAAGELGLYEFELASIEDHFPAEQIAEAFEAFCDSLQEFNAEEARQDALNTDAAYNEGDDDEDEEDDDEGEEE